MSDQQEKKPVPGLGDRHRIEVRAAPELNEKIEYVLEKLGITKNSYFLMSACFAATFVVDPVISQTEDRRAIATMLREQFEQIVSILEQPPKTLATVAQESTPPVEEQPKKRKKKAGKETS